MQDPDPTGIRIHNIEVKSTSLFLWCRYGGRADRAGGQQPAGAAGAAQHDQQGHEAYHVSGHHHIKDAFFPPSIHICQKMVLNCTS